MPELPEDPFMNGANPITGGPMGAVTTADRMDAVRRFTRAQCMDALFIDDNRQHLQKSVRVAIARRLRALEKRDLDAIRAEAGVS